MPIDLDSVDDVAGVVAGAYREAEAALVALITRRLAAGLDAPTWAYTKLGEVWALRRSAETIVARLAGSATTRLRQAVAAGFRSGQGTAVLDLPARHGGRPRMGGLVGDPRAEPGLGNARAGARASGTRVQALADAVVAELRPVHAAILPAVDNAYRRAVAGATARHLAGGIDRRTAAQAAWSQLVTQGITTFVDKSGRRWSLPSYVEMSTRTAVHRAALIGQNDTWLAAGHTLVSVIDSPRECALCVVAGTLVEGPVPEWACRLEYAGDVISIATASGKNLTGTPDHTVLTPRGWRRLKDLAPGDQVVSDDRQHDLARVVPHHVQVPTRIEDFPQAGTPFLATGPTRRDLDRNVAYRDIHDIRADRHLLAELYAALGQPGGELGLVPGVGSAAGLLGLGDAFPDLTGPGDATVGLMGGAGPRDALLGGCGVPSGPQALADQAGALGRLGLGHVLGHPMVPGAGGDAGAAQVIGYGPAADSEGGAELLRALAGQVSADEIVRLDVREFVGHVWDLQTAPSWYLTNGIVTHNCRPWETKILSLTDEVVPPAVATLDAAQAAGLFHPNCRHKLRLYVAGVSRPTPARNPEGQAGYDAEQRQRGLERHIRHWKMRQVAAFTPAEAGNAARRVGAWEQALDQHLGEHRRLRRVRYRETIGVGHTAPRGRRDDRAVLAVGR